MGSPAFEPILGELKNLPDLNKDSIQYYIDWDKTVKYKVERGEGECAV